ncbi:MAG: hypothetical protein HQM10_03470 [Candidatus Riflebacteria bacterium]|nr:hypothetical protein [Candidatus Riflebacteria bacterium]
MNEIYYKVSKSIAWALIPKLMTFYLVFRYLPIPPCQGINQFEPLEYWVNYVFLPAVLFSAVFSIIDGRIFRNKDRSIVSVYETLTFFPLFLLLFDYPKYAASFMANSSFHGGLPCICTEGNHPDLFFFYYLKNVLCTWEFSHLSLVLYLIYGNFREDEAETYSEGMPDKDITLENYYRNRKMQNAIFLLPLCTVIPFWIYFFVAEKIGKYLSFLPRSFFDVYFPDFIGLISFLCSCYFLISIHKINIERQHTPITSGQT